jgi:hypothetical protein
MNHDSASHAAADVNLCDALEDTAGPSIPALEIVERLKELKRNTWGYQAPNECCVGFVKDVLRKVCSS